MRIMIKGGVWKNTEDEILKAAVMKYGKNQWARISSLLVRKSAKQCKARWYEWLDPSIKKTEWTREEDEKLLHLAKLMPTQWRTIAPIVGRTPSQCLERYEKLLDAACVKDDNYEPGDDPRKLRPGEIDPNPESKPARPDPVDMDEDEKEMLSEARARLANTKGKKAKRKAREKQLEEARRLASLQKKRELKAAGIDVRQRRRKRRGIDYNAEIPFEKRPPPGYFDVADEDRVVEQPAFPTTIEELEGKRRIDVEAQLRKQDVARNKIAERQDAPAAILHANKLNDPETVRKRSKLMLPPPQISDQELDEIAKLGYASDLVGSEELAEGSSATRALLSNYPQTPNQAMTPLRTPQRTPASKGDAIMMEAENLARLRESQTPLLGGENPELHPSDFSGVTPKKKEIHTPNPLLTPSATPGSAGLTPRSGMTPARDGFSFGMTPKGTPLRDELHINEDMEMHDSAKLELRRQADMKKGLRSGLSSLPQPKNEYQIVMQPVQEDAEEPEEKIEEDMSDRMAREKAEEEARQQALLRKRSKVLQRELPRPPPASIELIRNSLIRADGDKSSFVPPTNIEQADEMIRRELLTLLEHDNAKYPLEEIANKERKKGSKRAANGPAVPVIEDFQEDEMKDADKLIKDEAEYLRVAMGHENDSLDEFVEAHTTCINDLMFFVTRNAYGLSSVAGNMEKLAALQNEFENVRSKLDAGKEKLIRLEKKVTVLTQGYEMRSKMGLWPQIEATFKKMDVAATEFECFQALKKQEQLAAKHRINNLWSEVQKQKELERTLQKRYGDLMVELERTQNTMEQFRVEAQQKEEIEAKRTLQKRYGDLMVELERTQNTMEQFRVEAQQKEEIEAKNHAIEEVLAQKQEETEAKNHVLESTEATADEINVQGTENCEAVPISADQEIDTVQDQATSSSKIDMDVDSSCEAQATHITDVTLPDAPAAEDENSKAVEGKNIGSVIENSETAVDTSAAVEIKSNEENGEGQDNANPDEVIEAANKSDNIKEATLLDDMQVADGKGDEAN